MKIKSGKKDAQSPNGAAVANYRRDGFLAPIDCISRESARRFLDICDAFETETGESVTKHLRVRAILGLKWLMDLARGPVISGVLQDTVGPNVVLFLSGFWSKAPKTGKFVSWHQDGAYNPFDRNDGATVWLALTDASKEMGCMQFIPGSQRDPKVRHKETFAEDNLLSRGQTVIDVDEKSGDRCTHIGRTNFSPSRDGGTRIGSK